MAGRIVWIGIAGLALATGMVLQDGPRRWTWAAESGVSTHTERAIEARVDAAISRSIDKMEVVGPDGREIDVGPATKQEFAAAVGELAKAETDLAMIKVRDGSEGEREAATARRDAARGEVDRLKDAMKANDREAAVQRVADRQKIQQDVRQEIREAIRDAVKN